MIISLVVVKKNFRIYSLGDGGGIGLHSTYVIISRLNFSDLFVTKRFFFDNKLQKTTQCQKRAILRASVGLIGYCDKIMDRKTHKKGIFSH
jgi:hypothetical protein